MNLCVSVRPEPNKETITNNLTFPPSEKIQDYLRFYIHVLTFYLYILLERKTLNIQVLGAIKIQFVSLNSLQGTDVFVSLDCCCVEE